jgi:hypothetical protein
MCYVKVPKAETTSCQTSKSIYTIPYGKYGNQVHVTPPQYIGRMCSHSLQDHNIITRTVIFDPPSETLTQTSMRILNPIQNSQKHQNINQSPHAATWNANIQAPMKTGLNTLHK